MYMATIKVINSHVCQHGSYKVFLFQLCNINIHFVAFLSLCLLSSACKAAKGSRGEKNKGEQVTNHYHASCSMFTAEALLRQNMQQGGKECVSYGLGDKNTAVNELWSVFLYLSELFREIKIFYVHVQCGIIVTLPLLG